MAAGRAARKRGCSVSRLLPPAHEGKLISPPSVVCAVATNWSAAMRVSTKRQSMLNAETVHATLASCTCTLALSLASALAMSLASIRDSATISTGLLPRSNGRVDLEAEGASDRMPAWP